MAMGSIWLPFQMLIGSDDLMDCKFHYRVSGLKLLVVQYFGAWPESSYQQQKPNILLH
jgi:hypothetical protein